RQAGRLLGRLPRRRGIGLAGKKIALPRSGRRRRVRMSRTLPSPRGLLPRLARAALCPRLGDDGLAERQPFGGLGAFNERGRDRRQRIEAIGETDDGEIAPETEETRKVRQ